MPHKVEPQIFCIGETRVNNDELENYLKSIGAEGWESDALDGISEIIEVDGRGCYLSFGTELNDNITRVRETNESYLKNIINVRHGSVLEHGFINFQIVDVSRVFTHELVRHRAGTAISQESLRFVRANDLGYWIPPCFDDISEIESLFKNAWKIAESNYEKVLVLCAEKEYRIQYRITPDSIVSKTHSELIEYFNSLSLDIKKKYTSAARRFLPIGMATKIGWSCNIRTLRTVLEQRTHPSSEEEIRMVFSKIGLIALERWPNLFSDYSPVYVEGYYHFQTNNTKI